MREHILQLPEGAYLGSEEDLALRFEAGRHTLRQAARLLEEQHLLKVKRGVSGGYYGVRPDIDTVADAAATYLRTRGGLRTDQMALMSVLAAELSGRAARSQDETARQWLRDILARLVAMPLSSTSEVEQMDFEFRDCLFALADNPFIEFMLRIQVRYAFQEPDYPLVDPADRLERYRKSHIKLAEAILEQDTEVAMLTSRRFGQMVAEWIAEARPRLGRDPAKAAGPSAGS